MKQNIRKRLWEFLLQKYIFSDFIDFLSSRLIFESVRWESVEQGMVDRSLLDFSSMQGLDWCVTHSRKRRLLKVLSHVASWLDVWHCFWYWIFIFNYSSRAHASWQRGRGFKSRRVLGFLFSILTVGRPSSGPSQKLNTTDFPIKKLVKPCSLRRNKLHMHGLRKKLKLNPASLRCRRSAATLETKFRSWCRRESHQQFRSDSGKGRVPSRCAALQYSYLS